MKRKKNNTNGIIAPLINLQPWTDQYHLNQLAKVPTSKGLHLQVQKKLEMEAMIYLVSCTQHLLWTQNFLWPLEPGKVAAVQKGAIQLTRAQEKRNAPPWRTKSNINIINRWVNGGQILKTQTYSPMISILCQTHWIHCLLAHIMSIFYNKLGPFTKLYFNCGKIELIQHVALLYDRSS